MFPSKNEHLVISLEEDISKSPVGGDPIHPYVKVWGPRRDQDFYTIEILDCNDDLLHTTSFPVGTSPTKVKNAVKTLLAGLAAVNLKVQASEFSSKAMPDWL